MWRHKNSIILVNKNTTSGQETVAIVIFLISATYPPARKWTQENWRPANFFCGSTALASSGCEDDETTAAFDEELLLLLLLYFCCCCCSCWNVLVVAEVEGRMVGRIIELPLVAAAALEALISVCTMRVVGNEVVFGVWE